MSRRGATNLSGILLVDKPPGITSHDVVSSVRSASGERRVGHTGTLDPIATGLLVILVGPATRLNPYLTAASKNYIADVVFGTETDTDDREGAVTHTAHVPASCVDETAAAAVVAGLAGTFQQDPPAYSALKVDGVVAHRAARAGTPLHIEPRTVTIERASLVSINPGAPVVWRIDVTVSKGTYVRAIARDLGRQLGSAAHLGELRRAAVGALSVNDAVRLETLTAPDDIASAFIDPVSALGMPVLTVEPHEATAVTHGVPLDTRRASGLPLGPIAVVSGERFLGVYDHSDTSFKPSVVIPGGIGGVVL